MFSKRELEGYIRIDHRESPGLDMPFVGRNTLFESSTVTCSHCQRIVINNPQRTRARGYCPKCDHYICDLCEDERVRTGVCKPFKQIIDEFIDLTAKGLPYGT